MEAYSDILDFVNTNNAQLVAVSKTRSNEEIMSLYQQGQRDFGENRIEEIDRKKTELPADIRWHLIGPLQSKKVKYFSTDVHLFHALDRVKIWNLLNQWAEANDVVVEALIQVHIAQEPSKHGFSPEALKSLLDGDILKQNSHVHIRGLMAMATNTNDEAQVRSEFNEVYELFHYLKKEHFTNERFNQLSMGMSNDYKLALDNGATMVRIGSLIFGPRQY